jgi:hypothetical protein
MVMGEGERIRSAKVMQRGTITRKINHKEKHWESNLPQERLEHPSPYRSSRLTQSFPSMTQQNENPVSRQGERATGTGASSIM